MRRLSILCVMTMVFGIEAIVNATPIYNPGNGHYYERMPLDVNWNEARVMAESMVWMGTTGHLATITSADENWWIVNNLGGRLTLDNFLGGYFDGSSWKWVTGEPWEYENWFPGEPNGDGTALQYDDAETNPSVLGYWNDFPDSRSENGFIVEYDTAPIPEPSTMLLVFSGLIGLAGFRKKIRK